MSEERPEVSNMGEEAEAPGVATAEEFPGGLPYGIKPREVRYKCLKCGYEFSKDEVEQLGELMCPHCGYRIFIRVRSMDVPPRRVQAI